MQNSTEKRRAGRPKLGNQRKLTINICLNREIIELLDSIAISKNLSRSALISLLISSEKNL